MENQKNNSYFVQSVSIMDILRLLLSKWYIILLVALLFTGIAGAYTDFMVDPTYDAYTTLYVFNKAEGAQGSVTSSDLTASADLAESYKVILSSRSLREALIKEVKDNNSEYALLNLTPAYLSKAVTVSNVNETQVIRISVTTTDPELSAAIANAYALVSPNEMAEITEVGKVNIVDWAKVPTAPSGPSMARNCAFGFIVGALLVAAILVLKMLSDTIIHDVDDIQKITDTTIIGSVPSFRTKNVAKEFNLTIVKGRNIADEN